MYVYREGKITGVKQVLAVVIGRGSAGLAAAVQLYRRGITDIVIFEREKKPGRILRQCIHDGFGLMRFEETLSSPEYVQRLMDMMDGMGTPYITDITVSETTPDKRIYASSREGMIELQAKAVILTMGCRKGTGGAMSILGEQPAGVCTASVTQAYVNLQNRMVGREAAILGSGDIGMIMARRLTLEGAHVQTVFEIQPHSSGFSRNIEQRLRDCDTPLYLSRAMTDILGKKRLGGVVVSRVDGHIQPVPGSEKTYTCNTLILSVGLMPESELSLEVGIILDGRSKGVVTDENYQTSVDGIFAAGNVLHVHDLVDFVPREAEQLGDAAAEHVRKGDLPSYGPDIRTNEHITHIIPQKTGGNRSFYLFLRVKRPTGDCRIQVLQGGRVIKEQTSKKTNPAEMIQITVDASVLNCREGVEVKVV